jgi:putative membrane protein
LKEAKENYRMLWAFSLSAVFVWSAIHPHDYFTWMLEVTPAIIGVIVLAATYRTFRLTTLLYTLIWLHAEVPLFSWIRDAFSLSRNHYDRLGHFAQGFVPAMITREILLRTTPLKRGKMLFLLVVSVCLAISATYELIEWLVAVLTGTAAGAFLGTQGDVWDTQWDMFFCLIGAVTALITLSRYHDRSLEEISEGS